MNKNKTLQTTIREITAAIHACVNGKEIPDLAKRVNEEAKKEGIIEGVETLALANAVLKEIAREKSKGQIFLEEVSEEDISTVSDLFTDTEIPKLLQWIEKNPIRINLINEAIQEYEERDFISAIQTAQALEAFSATKATINAIKKLNKS